MASRLKARAPATKICTNQPLTDQPPPTPDQRTEPGDKLKDITGRQQAAAGMGIYGPRTVYLIAITGYPGTHEFLLMDDGKVGGWVWGLGRGGGVVRGEGGVWGGWRLGFIGEGAERRGTPATPPRTQPASTRCPSNRASPNPDATPTPPQWMHVKETTHIGEGKLFAPGNLRATFDNPAYERLISYYLGEKYTLR